MFVGVGVPSIIVFGRGPGLLKSTAIIANGLAYRTQSGDMLTASDDAVLNFFKSTQPRDALRVGSSVLVSESGNMLIALPFAIQQLQKAVANE